MAKEKRIIMRVFYNKKNTPRISNDFDITDWSEDQHDNLVVKVLCLSPICRIKYKTKKVKIKNV